MSGLRHAQAQMADSSSNNAVPQPLHVIDKRTCSGRNDVCKQACMPALSVAAVVDRVRWPVE
jgi:hypothetical protein